jgi:hypothetical protein
MKDFARGFISGLIFLMLLFANPAFADFSENYHDIDYVIYFDDVNSPSSQDFEIPAESIAPESFSCSVSELTDAEANKIINLAGEGFAGEKIDDGKDSNGVKTDLEGLELVGESTDGETAVKQAPPTASTDAERFSFFSEREVVGPFGVGMILDDTVRVGRCVDLEQEECRIYGRGLEYRTSGKGVVSDLKNSWTSLSDEVQREAAGIDDEEYEKLQNNFLDNNTDNFRVAGVTPTDIIPNSFETRRYTATAATTCNNAACIISTYSGFDKYFNSFYSAELVVSNFGPTILGGANRLFGATRRNQGAGFQGFKKFNEKLSDLTEKWRGIPADTLQLNRGLMFKERENQYGLGNYFKGLLIDKKLFSTGAKGEIFDVTSAAAEIKKAPRETKEQFFKALTDLRAFAKHGNAEVLAMKSQYVPRINAGDVDAQIEFARKLSKQYVHWDDTLALDYPQWIKDSGNLGSFKEFTVRKNITGADAGYVNLADEGAFNTAKMFEEFSKDGSFDGWARSNDPKAFLADEGKGIKLFELQPNRTINDSVGAGDLKQYLNLHGEGTYSVRIRETGKVYPLSDDIVNQVDSGELGGTLDIVTGEWAPKRRLNPETGLMEDQYLSPQVLSEILTQPRVYGRMNTANRNLDDLYYHLRQDPQFTGGRSFGFLDEQLRQEKKFLTEYYKSPLKTGIYTGTVKPLTYWHAKKGLGYEEFSAFMLPDTWTQVEIKQGGESIYNDSYIDFYANEGSDQGDLFQRVLNYPVFAWNAILTKASEENNDVLFDYVSRLTGSSGTLYSEGFPLSTKTIMRDEVKNIAFYSHNENCSGCSSNFSFNDDRLTFGTNAPSKIDAFIVEATPADLADKRGSTIIAYTHASNLEGKDGSVPQGEINLVQARRDGETCEQALEDSLVGFVIPKNHSAGLILAGAESFAYVAGIGPGLIATTFMQLLVTSDLQDCVDDKEGYYVHFYDPPLSESEAKKPKESVSAQNVTETFSKLSENLDSVAAQGNPVAGAFSELSEDFKDFTDTAKKDNLLQAKIELLPPNKGTATGSEVFYIWYKGNMMPTGLKTEGEMRLTDGNNTFGINFEEGSASINGEKVVDDKKEITGLAINDTRVPATILPKKVNTVSAPNTADPVFELTTNGEIFVIDDKVLDCIRQAILEQTGIEYSGEELTNVFGNLVGINTSNYQKVFVREGEIHLEGSGNRAKGGLGSKFIINGMWDARLRVDANRNVDAGKFIGMSFDNGSIVINEETDELVIWLRQHRNSVLTTDEVSGLNATPDTITTEEGCEQPAINLEALGFSGDDLGQQKVENFNTSMEQLGPFTQFTTDGKIYQFYAERDETGECKDYFRVIDKETGQVITDSEIVGSIGQDAEGGLNFRTADGKSHNLDFDAENGVPKLSYNGGAPETLRTAQGPNGSFWYDPDSGKWYPENGIQIPLGQGFKDNGAFFGTDQSGNVSGTAGNPMTFNIGNQGSEGFNIPSMPESIALQAVFIAMFLAVAFYISRKEEFE